MWADAATPQQPQRRVANPADAQGLITDIRATMAALEKILAVETEHVRVGRVSEGLADESRKAELTSTYIRGLEALKANAVALARFAPEGLEILKRDHEAFARVIETNQIVLATARAVSEGLIKGVAEELGRGAQTQGYRPAGAPLTRAPAASPVLVSKTY
ncbi:MAG: hypothetical protein EA385_10845 [Salinarimonadaceae bacterium]|nr:MAG: hypothetical protein EA385_10845 [Salinarimonadaceae bacterium]